MSKSIVAGAAILGVAIVGIGGYFAVDYKIRTTIRDEFDTAVRTNPLISSASYDTIDVDLMNDRVTLKAVKLDANLSALNEQFSAVQPGMRVEGNMQQSFETITVTGVWSNVFGANKAEHLDIKGGAFNGTIIQTIERPVRGKQLVQKTVTPNSTRRITTFDGTMASAQIDGLEFLSPESVSGSTPVPFALDGYDAQDLNIAMALKSASKSMSGAKNLDAKQPQTVHLDMTMARLHGKQLSPTYYGLIRYEDITIDMENPKPGEAPIHLTMGEFSVSDTEIVDLVAVRATSEVKDLIIDTSNLKDPKGKAFMTMLGIDQINLNMKLAYNYDAANHSVRVSPFRLGLKQAGSVDVSFALNSLPDMDTLTKLDGMQGGREEINAALESALKDVALGQVALGYRDEGVLKKFLAGLALKMKAEPAQLAQAYAQQGAMIITATHGEEQALKAQKTLTAFLTDPDALRIKLTAKTPVKLKALSDAIEANGPLALKAFDLEVQGGADAVLH